MQSKDTVYMAMYSPDNESCAGVISLHRTKEGAEKAIAWHKHTESWTNDDLEIEAWFVKEEEIKD